MKKTLFFKAEIERELILVSGSQPLTAAVQIPEDIFAKRILPGSFSIATIEVIVTFVELLQFLSCSSDSEHFPHGPRSGD